MGQYNTDFVGC